MDFKSSILNLITETLCVIPNDVRDALRSAMTSEESSSIAHGQLHNIIENINLAEKNMRPLCQDTGILTFYIKAPAGFKYAIFEDAAKAAIAEAVEKGIIRKNAVCPVSNKNTGNGVGLGIPAFCWEQNSAEYLDVRLLAKGGGSENIGGQYSLPDISLNAERNMEGVRRCVLDAVCRAQGLGCPPVSVSVCIGGDRATSYAEAKKNFLRGIGERNPDPILADFERKLLREINQLGIGPSGLGGKTTALEVFVSALSRHPACFFVSVSQMCWAWRRGYAKIAIPPFFEKT